MKLLFLLSTLWVSIAAAQSPTDVIFTKYNHKNGVEISKDVLSLSEDSATKIPLSTSIKTLHVEKEDGGRRVTRLAKQVLRDCNKILDRNDYAVIFNISDDISSNKVYKYQYGNVTEICEVEQDTDWLTLTVTRITGLIEDKKENVKVDSKK